MYTLCNFFVAADSIVERGQCNRALHARSLYSLSLSILSLFIHSLSLFSLSLFTLSLYSLSLYSLSLSLSFVLSCCRVVVVRTHVVSTYKRKHKLIYFVVFYVVVVVRFQFCFFV
jgi:hypothetical protein